MAEVRWTNQSLEDINTIAEYISKDSKRYADMQVSEFFNSTLILQKFPKTGKIVPELKDKSIRELIIGFYRIIYRIKING